MNTLAAIIAANLIVSLGSLAGILTLTMSREKLNRILLVLVALSAGSMMGGAFFHLLPEAAKSLEIDQVYLIVFAAFTLFFLIEKLLYWRHCHDGHCRVHSFGYLNLLGDSLHNFIDGLIIAGAFLTDFNLGLATVLAVSLHEIPQEVGDFGVLLYSGWGRAKALIVNLLVGLTAVLGGVVGFVLADRIDNFAAMLLPFAAGGFIYIAASDLMPEIRKETSLKKSLASFGVFLAGVALIYLVK